MVKDTGLRTISIVGLLLALFSASTCIADEIEGRTAMTLLSKPINRRQFIFGKFLGILAAVAVLVIILGIAFSGTVYCKIGYDAQEKGGDMPEPEVRWAHVQDVQPGVVLAFFEVAVLTSVSVAVSTRLPMAVNIILCLAVYVLGHITPLLVRQAETAFEGVKFFAKLFALALPALENFNLSSAVATGTVVPWVDYVFPVFLYTAFYCAAALMLANFLFEERDLA